MGSNIKRAALLSAVAAWTLGAHPAQASGGSILTAASTSGDAGIWVAGVGENEVSFGPDAGGGTSAAVANSLGSASAYGSTGSTSNPRIFTTGSVGADPTHATATGDVQLTYSVEVLGPSATLVPIDVFSKFYAENTGNSSFSENLTMNFDVPIVDSFTSTGDDVYEAFGDQSAGLWAGTEYQVTMTIDASASNFLDEYPLYHGAASFTAWIDPYFEIDPTFLAANPGYSIEVSPGVGNSPLAVPEPAAWADLLVGFLASGALLRSRRRMAQV